MTVELDRLLGRWRLERTFEPAAGSFTGTARFRPAGPGRLHYREQGLLTLPTGWTGTARRAQLWVLDGAELRIHLLPDAGTPTDRGDSGEGDPRAGDSRDGDSRDGASPGAVGDGGEGDAVEVGAVGAVLHTLPAAVLTGAVAPAAVHRCGADVYTGTYLFPAADRGGAEDAAAGQARADRSGLGVSGPGVVGTDRFEVVMDVRGPAKALRIHTVACRG